jgi:hypothetical protein
MGQSWGYFPFMCNRSRCIYFPPLAVVYKSRDHIAVDFTTATVQDSYTSAHVGRNFVSFKALSHEFSGS